LVNSGVKTGSAQAPTQHRRREVTQCVCETELKQIHFNGSIICAETMLGDNFDILKYLNFAQILQEIMLKRLFALMLLKFFATLVNVYCIVV